MLSLHGEVIIYLLIAISCRCQCGWRWCWSCCLLLLYLCWDSWRLHGLDWMAAELIGANPIAIASCWFGRNKPIKLRDVAHEMEDAFVGFRDAECNADARTWSIRQEFSNLILNHTGVIISLSLLFHSYSSTIVSECRLTTPSFFISSMCHWSSKCDVFFCYTIRTWVTSVRFNKNTVLTRFYFRPIERIFSAYRLETIETELNNQRSKQHSSTDSLTKWSTSKISA